MKPCQKCHVPKDEEEYSWRFKVLGKRDAICKECRKKYNDQYFSGPAKERHLEQVRERKQVAREHAREYLLNYLSTHPCEHCGESDIRVLELHHVGDKDKTVSQMVGEGLSTERIQRELEKCQVLCANCHRKLTIEERGHWRGRK
jgi:hypothetical protein